MFQMQIRLENDAFQPEAVPEVVRILREVADRLENGDPGEFYFYRDLRDINGNVVGQARLRPDEEER